ncbi:MAG TPA: thiamine pyrophosphate-dependent enzyme, partial [Xanthobacteraceae bacterium]|nr:thiamine pyrophosphate-dependent enzyme [Xanthobacteraceae bacterium]
VIMAGDAVAQSRAHAELVELAELLGAPVYTEFVPSTASFPASHPLFRGSMIRLAPDVRKVLEQYDVLFSVGGDLFTLSLPSEVDPMPPAIKLIHLDVDPWELGKNYPPAVAILGDPKGTLPDIIAAVRERMTSGARGAARERLAAATKAIAAERDALAAKARALAQATPIQPLALLHAIGEMLPRDAVVIEEALSSAPGIRQLIRSDDPQSYFGLRGGGIGWGLPAAIGVKLALPDRPVVGLIGDGSAMYTCQGLWTAAHYRIGAVFVILNNSSYRILKQRLHAMRGLAEQADSYVGMELLDPKIDFVSLARSLGVAAERAKTVHEATDLIAHALKNGGPMLIDVEVDRAFKPM